MERWNNEKWLTFVWKTSDFPKTFQYSKPNLNQMTSFPGLIESTCFSSTSLYYQLFKKISFPLLILEKKTKINQSNIHLPCIYRSPLSELLLNILFLAFCFFLQDLLLVLLSNIDRFYNFIFVIENKFTLLLLLFILIRL